jgi:putative multicomponent Na+:H+ antiporter subunit B
LNDSLALLLPIAALLPLTAALLILQRSPFQTLVLRGILGAVATLIYALLGAADVALTEALVGTLLSTTLYAIALRSSMVFRLTLVDGSQLDDSRRALLEQWMQQAYLRLELVEDDPHGWLSPEGQLRIESPRLLAQLDSLSGAGDWRATGGELVALSDEGATPPGRGQP